MVQHALRILGVGSYLPPRRLSNQDLIDGGAPIEDYWVREKLGIQYRHVADEGVATSDLALIAAKRAIAYSEIPASRLDMIIVATAIPDRQAPATACILEEKLGLRGIPAFDVAAVCCGFLFALVIANAFIRSGTAKNVLVVGADTFSKITDWQRRDAPFFGDGAGAVVVSRSNDGSLGLVSDIQSHGSGINHFTMMHDAPSYTMDAGGVAQAASEHMPANIKNVLRKSNLEVDDVDIVIPHQPSISLLKKIAERSNIDFMKFQTNMDKYANTAGATIPILLDECVRDGRIHSGQNVLFAAAGSGMTTGAAVYQCH